MSAIRALILGMLVLISIAPAAQAASVTLRWTAPGDDSLTGTAAEYDLRQASVPITDETFGGFLRVPGVPPPHRSGTPESFVADWLLPGETYFFAIRTGDRAGNWSRMSNLIRVTIPAGGFQVPGGSKKLPLVSAPWPNPCRSTVCFSIDVPEAQEVLVQAFDVAGRRVKTFARGVHQAGSLPVAWDLCDDFGHSLESGLYIVRGRIGSTTFIRRVSIVR